MCHFSWQAQNSVKFMCHFSWQAQHLVKFGCYFAWQAQHLVKFMCHFSWQVQHLVKFRCRFSWQAQHLVKFGMIAGAGNVVIFNRICSRRVWKVASVARRVAVCEFMVGSVSNHGRIGLGSWSDHSRIGRALEMWCGWIMRFILRGRRSIWWGWSVLTDAPRVVNDVSYVMRLNHEIHFAWQAQYLVRLERVDWCSAQCKYV